MARNAKLTAATKSAAASWWLEEGEHDCPHCEQSYSYEVEVRCFECDAPICPMCIVRVDEHLFCPDCQEREQ
jgi:hypothetical protein